MRRLVVGSGYLGGRVAQLWRESGDDVYATTRGSNAAALAETGLQPVILDVTGGVPEVLPVVDTVLFAVGRDRRSGATMFDVHVTGFRAVLDALRGPAVRVIYTSSTGVYGQDVGEWVDETSVCEPASEAGRACLAAERLLFAHARGNDAVVLRLAGLYGPGRVPHAADITAGKPLAGSEHAYLNLIHVDDAARAVVAAANVRHFSDRTFVVSDGQPQTRGAYAAFLAAHLGVAAPSFEGAASLGKRVRNDRAISALELALRYPSYCEGLTCLVSIN